jgi:hypothetical protein
MRSDTRRLSHVDRLLRSLVILFFLLGTGSPAAAGGDYALFLPMISKNWVNALGNIHGVVIDAVDKSLVEGVKVCYFEKCAMTNGQGKYTLSDLPPSYVVLEATKDTYIPQTAGVTVLGNQTVSFNIVISQELINNNVEFRFVVTWRTEEIWPPLFVDNDLDSHLWLIAPPEEALSAHIDSYLDRGSCVNFPYACVEADTTQGSGPETVDISKLNANTMYYFGVLNVNASYDGVPPITESKAKIQVFDTSGLIHTFNVPTSGTGDLWYVFMMDYSRTMTPTNCITTLPPDVPPGNPIIPPQCP